MKALSTFLKGIVVGLGAVAPGLSGSILLVIFGLYQKVVSTVSHLFKGFKKNLLFLCPLALGIGLGMVVFSKLISIPLDAFPMPTYYAFLGLILGTIPMLWKEVRKEGMHLRHYLYMVVAFALGVTFFVLNVGKFPDLVNPNILQSMLLGLAVSAAYLVPGVDSFAILSAFGLYNLWKDSLANLDLGVLLPAVIGFGVGGIAISLIFNKLFAKWYTATYSLIFGVFASVILNFVFKEIAPASADFGFNAESIVSMLLLFAGFAASLLFSHMEDLARKFRKKQPTAPETVSTGAPAEQANAVPDDTTEIAPDETATEDETEV